MTTATKGIPANKIEVRPQEQQPQYSGPTTAFNPMLVGLSNEAQLILATSLGTTGLVSPSKQLLAKQLLESNTMDYPALNMDTALDNLSPQPPASRLQQQQQSALPQASIPPRSAKITMEEAAESAVTLAAPDQPPRMPGASSRLPNGRPPAIQTGTT